MRLVPTELPGAVVIEPVVHGDARGYFKEAWRESTWLAAGLPAHFVQCNVSRSQHGVLRGLHYQHPNPQGKLLWVLEGAIWDVAVDIRRGSPHYGRWAGVELSADNHRQFFVPEGFAHGFCVTSESALVCYMCTAEFEARHDRAIAWDDPSIAIEWPLQPAALSDRDKSAPRLDELRPEQLPEYH